MPEKKANLFSAKFINGGHVYFLAQNYSCAAKTLEEFYEGIDEAKIERIEFLSDLLGPNEKGFNVSYNGGKK